MNIKGFIGICLLGYISFSDGANAETIDSLNSKIETTEESILDLSEKQENIKYEIIKLEKNITNLQIQKFEQKSEIMNLNYKISTLDEEFKESERIMKQRKEILKKRALRLQEDNAYMSLFNVILESENINDFVNRLGAVATIIEMDRSIIEELETEQQSLLDLKKRRSARLDQVKIEEDSLNQIENELLKEKQIQTSLLEQLDDEKTLKLSRKERLITILNEKKQASTNFNVPIPISPSGNGQNYDVRNVSNVTVDQINAMLKGKLKGYGETFYRVGYDFGIDPAFLAAISMAETGGDSNWLRKYNNIGGFIHNGPMRFATIEEGINYMGSLLTRLYLKDGLVTVEQIHTRYSPKGAANDPTNLNSNWVRNVYAYMAAAGVK